MKSFYLISLLSIIFCKIGYSQSPGYMGKRASIGYSSIFSASKLTEEILLSPFQEYYYTDPYDPGFQLLSNQNHQIHFDYLITRGTAIGGYLSFWKKNQHSIPIEERIYSPYYTTHNFGYDPHPLILEEGQDIHGEYRDYLYNGKGKLSGQGLGIYFKFFGKKPLAPLGDYFQVTILVNRTSSYQEKTVINENNKTVSYHKINTQNIYSPALILSYGKQWMIFERVLINTAIETGLSFPFGFKDTSLNPAYTDYTYHSYDSDGFYKGEELTKQERIKINTQHGLQYNYLLQFRLGISYMAF